MRRRLRIGLSHNNIRKGTVMSKHKHVQKRDINPTPAALEALSLRHQEELREKRAMAEHLTLAGGPPSKPSLSGGEAGPAMISEATKNAVPSLADEAEIIEVMRDAQEALRQLFALQVQAAQAVLDLWTAWMLPQKNARLQQ